MDVSNIINNLNDPQREAVTASNQHQLVLAGAGSGKTRVLVHRIAWLIQVQGISPHGILAVTFTNKAAAEMRGRIEEMLHSPMHGMWVGTFHGLAHRLLRAHWQDAGLPQTFQVLDGEDQYRLIRRVLKNLNLDESKWPPKQAQWFINAQKDEGLRSHQIQANGHLFTETMIKVYQEYETTCQRGGLVDFAELLLRSYEVWLKNPQLLAHYQKRFQYILVDEFQDTNAIQYAWLKLLAGKAAHLLMVGDDDQSIYSWRGAKVEHILSFNKDFDDVKTIRLEQNYRSTKIILDAANSIIANNSNRLGKNLWTSGNQGECISLYAGFNDIDEARFIVSRIQEWVSQGGAKKDIAILYRSNAQSRVLEEQLIRESIPYRVYGGFKYFERAEVKDALAYMRLVDNTNDDSAFERIINTPTRGIGHSTLEALREFAKKNNYSLWQATEAMLTEKLLPSRAGTCLIQFLQLIQNLRNCRHLDLSELTEIIIHKTGLHDFYSKDRSEKGLSRIENLEELISAAQQYVPEEQETTEISPLTSFLAYTALETGEKQAENFTDSIHLMTLHAAKGLEFPLVFLTGMEEGLFPHKMSTQELHQLEEERRLCYVGMTRAMQKLFITYAECRRLHGDETYQHPSRFIQEIPEELVEEVRMRHKVSRPVSVSSHPISRDIAETLGFRLGQRVRHSKFGEGMILNYEGEGEHARVQVKFNKAGVKWLVASYAKLEVSE